MINQFADCFSCGEEVCIKDDEIPPRFLIVCKKEECCNKAIKLLSVEKNKANLVSVLLGIRIKEIESSLIKKSLQIPETTLTES